MIQNIVAFILLFTPTSWELSNDKNGDINKKHDVYIRIILMLAFSFSPRHFEWAKFLISFNMSAAIFFLFFDYLISYILIHNGTIELPRGSKYTWFNYTAKSGFVDRVPWWSKLNPYVKLLIRVVYFGLSAVLYFKR